MAMNEHDFREYLLIYGSDLSQWPDSIQQAGRDALQGSKTLQDLVAEEYEFVSVLKASHLEEPSADLAERIISASLKTEQKRSFSLSGLLSELFGVFAMPKRAIVSFSIIMILILLIGFAIGFSASPGSSVTEQASTTGLQDILYSVEGALL